MSGSADRDEDEPAVAPTIAAGELRSGGLLDELLDVERREVASAPASATVPTSERILGTRVGWFVDWEPGQAPRVDFEGNSLGPVPARSVIPLTPDDVSTAIAERQGVVLSFDAGRPNAPIVTGVLQPLVNPTQPDPDQTTGEGEAELELSRDTELDARVDGRRVEIEAADEIVLRCGQASIVLRRNGRVVIRGTYIETRSRGVNRIKGGSVEIN